MRNGYAMCTAEGLQAIAELLARLPHEAIDRLRAQLAIVVQYGVELTEAEIPGRLVSQAFCSALPVAYAGLAQSPWAPFATLVLEAAYEATLCAAAINAAERGSNVVLLTLLGGGVFGNRDPWIFAGLRSALQAAAFRVTEGGKITHRVETTQICFAVAVVGSKLVCLTAPDSHPDVVKEARLGKIEVYDLS